MSLDKQTGKHRQTKGRKVSLSLDDKTENALLLVQHTLTLSAGEQVTITDTLKWLIQFGGEFVEREIEKAARQNL